MPELHVQFSQRTDIVHEVRGLNVGHEGKGFRLANCLFFCILRDIKIWGHLASVSITGCNFQVSVPDRRKLSRVRISYRCGGFQRYLYSLNKEERRTENGCL